METKAITMIVESEPQTPLISMIQTLLEHEDEFLVLDGLKYKVCVKSHTTTTFLNYFSLTLTQYYFISALTCSLAPAAPPAVPL